MDDEMDVNEVIETVVWVEPEQADRDGLACTYCSGAKWVPYEPLRVEPHDACRDAADRYMAAQRDGL